MGQKSEAFECKTGLRQEHYLNEMEEKAKRLFKASHIMDLLVNEAKTKYIAMLTQVTQKNDIKVNGYSFSKWENLNIWE